MSNTKGKITHPGIIERIDSDTAYIRILSKSACSSCHAKGMCNVAEMEEKIVEVGSYEVAGHKEGDQIMLAMRQKLGAKAVLLGYIAPFLVMFLSLIILVSVTGKEGLSALIAVLLLVPYYTVLYFMKDKISKEFRFHILK